MRYLLVLIGFLFISLSGCGGGGGGDISDVSGTWDVKYGILGQDDCGLVSADLPGFIDRHTLVDDQGVVTLNSQNGFIVDGTATVDQNHNFLVEQDGVGVPFADGVQCQIFSSIGYTFESNDEANVTLLRQLNCVDGFVCESRAVGTAVREVVDLDS